jgi:hypothetical protein
MGELDFESFLQLIERSSTDIHRQKNNRSLPFCLSLFVSLCRFNMHKTCTAPIVRLRYGQWFPGRDDCDKFSCKVSLGVRDARLTTNQVRLANSLKLMNFLTAVHVLCMSRNVA